MSLGSTLRRPRTWLIAIPVIVILAVVVAPWIYINLIKEDAPERLSFQSAETTVTTADGAATTADAPATGEQTGLDGTWTVAQGSEAGYRAEEVLFGQDTEAVGRTTDVTGGLTVEGTTITTADFTVDMTTVASSESRRDGQFRNRIMDVANHPTATFVLTEPIELGTEPADLEEVTASATGDLTLRGETNSITFELKARRNGDTIEVNGTIPIEFADYGIPDASGGPATVKDHGEIEFLLRFTR